MRFIALSTWIRTLAICCVWITSSALIWAFWPSNGGILRVVPNGKMSCMVNPLSAIIVSPPTNAWSRKPLLITISRSDIDPVYSWLIKVMAPLGAIPISPLRVCDSCMN